MPIDTKFDKCVVKICISMEDEYNLMDSCIYFRSGLSPDFIEKWLWYFEYLVALVKVASPRRKVVLFTGTQDVLLGAEWHEYRRNVLLKSAQRKYAQLEAKIINDDLFHFTSQLHEDKKKEIRSKIKALENDTFPIDEFPEYINQVKLYLYPKNSKIFKNQSSLTVHVKNLSNHDNQNQS